MEILTHPNPLIYKACPECDVNDEARTDAGAMIQALCVDSGRIGVGLAAPQVGIFKRMFVISLSGYINDAKVYFNPRIIGHGRDVAVESEGCLSVPGQRRPMRRWAVIDVAYQRADGQFVRETLKRFEARVFQHELDHLDGIVCMFKKEE